jgi:hypothetical protein
MAEVKAVGSATRQNRTITGPIVQRAMSSAITTMAAAGISTDEKNSPVLRAGMMLARERALNGQDPNLTAEDIVALKQKYLG